MIEEKSKNVLGSEDIILSLDDVLSYKIAPGDLFWVRKNRTKVQLRKAGDPIEKSYFKKFDTVPCEFTLSDSSRINFIEDNVRIFRELESVTYEQEKWDLRNTFVKWLKRNYLNDESQATALEFMLIGTKSFLRLDPETEQELVEYSVANYRRSALAGMVAVSFALTLGYLDFKLLQDLYHLFFLQDYAFAKEGGNYIYSKAQEEDRTKVGGAVVTFANYNMSTQLMDFYRHPDRSFELIDEKKELFHQKGWSSFLKMHHEKLTGTGFQNKLNGDEIGDLEQIYIYVNSIIPYNDPDLTGNGEFKKYLSIDSKNNYELRILNNLKKAIDKMAGEEVAA